MEAAGSRLLHDCFYSLRRHQALRRLLRAGLKNHVSERPLGGTSLRVAFPADQHFGLFFARSISYEPELTAHLSEWVPKGGVAFDVGANLGLYTLLFSDRVGELGSVWSFEPDPQNLPWLRRNVEQNRLRNVHVEPYALGETSGELTLYQDVATSRTSSLVKDAWQLDATPRREASVHVEPLDHYVDLVSRLDFVKIDTEGFEVAVLRGGRELFRRFSPKLLVEVLERNRAEIEGLLGPLGYDFRDPATNARIGNGPWPGNVLCVPA
jgi:FkbM family methyltransferase